MEDPDDNNAFENEWENFDFNNLSAENFINQELNDFAHRSRTVFAEIQELPITKKAMEIIDMIDILINDNEDDIDRKFIKSILVGNATFILNQIVLTQMESSFIKRYEQCIRLRMEVENLIDKIKKTAAFEPEESDNAQSILREIEKFRLLFLSWNQILWELPKETDPWGLIRS